MFQVGIEAQEGLLIAAAVVMILIYRKFTRSRIPRVRVIILCFLCIILWFVSFVLSLHDLEPSHSLLWETLNLLSMAATLFVLFIAIFEIMQSPGY
jgi:uncharacterized membrane protein YkvI